MIIVFVCQTVQCKAVWQVVDLMLLVGCRRDAPVVAVLRADKTQPETHSQSNQKQFCPQGATFKGCIRCIHRVNQFETCIDSGHCTTTRIHPLCG